MRLLCKGRANGWALVVVGRSVDSPSKRNQLPGSQLPKNAGHPHHPLHAVLGGTHERNPLADADRTLGARSKQSEPDYFVNGASSYYATTAWLTKPSGSSRPLQHFTRARLLQQTSAIDLQPSSPGTNVNCRNQHVDFPTPEATSQSLHTTNPRRWRATWTADSAGGTRLSTTNNMCDRFTKNLRAT